MPVEAYLIQDATASVPLMAGQAPVAPLLGPTVAPAGPRPLRVGSLVLTRHPGESIMIGAEVEVHVVGIRGGIVRLKLVAPRSIPVHRREVYDAIQSGPTAGGSTTAPAAASTDARPGKPGGGLVLARSARQSVMIGKDIELAVVEVRPATVRLKVTAPKSVAVHRREVFEAIRDGFA